jgi:hypothetical protein
MFAMPAPFPNVYSAVNRARISFNRLRNDPS